MKKQTIAIIGVGVVLVGLLGGGYYYFHNHEENVSVSKEYNEKKEGEPLDEIDKEALKREVEVNPDGKTATERRTNKKTVTEATQKEYDKASEEGEFKDRDYSVVLPGGQKVVEEEIANTRKTLSDAGIEDMFFSDYEIALIKKEASDRSMDEVGVANDVLDGKIELKEDSQH